MAFVWIDDRGFHRGRADIHAGQKALHQTSDGVLRALGDASV
jgi:hypothetical protein